MIRITIHGALPDRIRDSIWDFAEALGQRGTPEEVLAAAILEELGGQGKPRIRLVGDANAWRPSCVIELPARVSPAHARFIASCVLSCLGFRGQVEAEEV